MKTWRSRNLGVSVMAMTLVLAIVATLLGTSTVFYHSEWFALVGLALFLLGGLPVLRTLTGFAPPEAFLPDRRTSSKKVSHSLIAVSSAAILAVYAAGFDRTNSAADRLEAESSSPRRHVVAAAETPEASVPVATASVAETTAAPTREVSRVSKSAAADVQQAAAPVPALETPASPIAEDKRPVDAAPDPTPKPVEPVVLVANAVPVPPPPVSVPPPPAAAAAPAQPQYRDGSFLGWGSCRHGQIQVEVVIQAGKIASAEIAQCRTRYSCSVIRTTPPQMVAKQNPELLDNVTGATQSVDAYYLAVKEALKEAAKPAQ